MKSQATGYPPIGWSLVCVELEIVDLNTPRGPTLTLVT